MTVGIHCKNIIMYRAKKSELKILVDVYNYTPEMVDLLDVESDKVRQSIPIDIDSALAVCTYQSALQSIRKSRKKWWHFWA